MPFQYEKIAGFAGGLINRVDPRDIKLRDPRGLSKAQNISLDVGGKIRTIGGLADFTKVDGVTALTQTAKICPGSGLFKYGSDHWRGTDTVVDMGPSSNAASDEQGEVDATTGWSATGTGPPTISSDATSQVGSKAIKGAAGVGETVGLTISSAITTVVGQRYKVHCWLRKSGGASYLRIGTSQYGTELAALPSPSANDTYEEFTEEIVATTTTTWVGYGHGPSSSDLYVDDFYFTAVPQRDLDTNWLALFDAANADNSTVSPQVDLYNVNDDSFTAGLLDFGTVSSYVATIDTINFPTTKTITDSTGQFLNKGVRAGDVRIISGCTSETANNIIFVVEHVNSGTITARGNPFTVAADEDGTVTLTKYNPVAFHYVNEALRASPANGGIALRPKHYSFADRTHFEGADSSERKWSDWYANDVGPVAPTDVAFDAAVDSGLSGNLTAGAGWEVGMTVTADDGEWPAGTYILACSFIYDDGQESALYVPSTDVAMTAITEGASLTLCAKADTATDYDERISGGRVYCRIDETDDPWTLLLDISMAKGARATLSGTYNAWAEGATADDVYTASFISKRQNLDSYETLAGIDPTTAVEVFDGDNAFWNTSVIARNRCFIGSVRYTAEGGSLSHFRDRILYSTVGAYDTFPIDNYIDVVQGDAEDYVKLGAYGNDLLCFKESTLYIVDISDPDPAGWQMKQDANKGKYPFRGIAHPGAYFETPIGPAWCNKFDVFLYNGSEIIELLKDKIELSEHPLAYQRYMEFDGSNDKLNHADDASLSAFTDMSAYARVYIDSGGSGTRMILEKGVTGSGANDEYSLYLGATNILNVEFYTSSGNSLKFTDTAALTTDTWYDIGFTFDTSDGTAGLTFYKRASGATTITTSTPTGVESGTFTGMADTASELHIFSRISSLYLKGRLAELIISSGELSAAVMALLFDSTPVGVGANYKMKLLPSGVGDALWTDSSSFSLSPTVVGATAIYEDSWAKFWTNYSILGYHARTNQLIIMRDCTGKWSSGQDYGDCLTIDLDTGAITTGRRVFTKGIAYSNWATDWDQELIIAEQTSSTSVTIKKWPDEPQSQAVGLIDIRTADFDFGNPAYAKFFDALVAYYKSSAAQTTPVSYAIDGNDRQTAWVRITGNFTEEAYWEKLTLEPTAFECDTIRFKIDNPTNAGTLELNEIVLRFTEEQEDID